MRVRDCTPEVCFIHCLEEAGESMFKKLVAAAISLTLLSGSLSSCGSEEASFCDAARSFEKSVREVDVERLASSLDEAFWNDLIATIDDLIESDSGQLRSELQVLREEVVAVDLRLAAVDYNLIAAALDPETAASYLAIAAALVLFAADELQAEINAAC
jgi:hypothetical protein